MDTFEITIQRRDGAGWPVIVEQSGPDSLTPERGEGGLMLDAAALRALELEAEAYGRALGEALFAGSVRDAFRRALSRSEERLRVLLFIEDAELRGLRWERLCAPIDDRWQILALSQRAPFSRYLPSLTDRRFPQIGRQHLRALLVAASPTGMTRFGLEPFDVAEAVGGVQRALDGIPTALLSDLPGSAGPPSLDAICAQISAEPFTLLHIVCHGQAIPDGESVIFLARDDDPSQVDPVTTDRLIERLGGLQGARGLPRLTFLASCESASPGADVALGGLAQRLVRDLGMPAVVAMTDKVQVATANALSAVFYARLRDHGEVDRALVEASSGLAERDTILVPVLFSRLGGQPLFNDSLDRPLSSDDIAAGLGLLAPLVGERAPVLVGELDAVAATLRRTLRADPAGLTREARQERDAALVAVDAICSEATELGFRALALGAKPPAYDARCPFPGLRSFKADARQFFFGRELLVQRLLERLDEHPFLAVLGASGSGKSSLVFAGLVPALQARRPELPLLTMTPGELPLASLLFALEQAGPPPSPDGGPSVARGILVVDQLEEAFTLCQDIDERKAFFAALLQQAGPFLVITTMRADFLGEVAPYPALRERVQGSQELVAPMTPEELRRAMELQAAAVGLRFEADLGGQILDDVRGEPGAMPLLQHALQELWQRRRGRWLRAAEYRAIGGIQRAIAHSADQIYDACSPADRERLRGIFVRLTRLDREALAGEERRDTRQRVALRDITPAGADPAPLRDLLRRLADARLVVTGVGADGAETVEVAHEALIRSWPRMRAWLEDDRAGLLLRDTIRLAAQEWQREERDQALLFRGSRLDEALALSELPRFAPNELERAFLDASVAQREQEAAEKEAARQRELEQARALAAEQQRRAEEQAAAAVRLRRRAVFLAGVATMAVAAMVAAVFLGFQAQRSEQAAQASAAEANQRALIANAQVTSNQGRPGLALALGLAAFGDEPVLPDTSRALSAIAEDAARRRVEIGVPESAGNLAFSPRGDELFVSTVPEVQVWAADGDRPARSLTIDMSRLGRSQISMNPGDGIKKIAISPDGTTIVGTTTYSLVSWGVAGMLSYWDDLGDRYLQDVAFFPDSHRVLLTTGDGGGPLVFDLHSRSVVTTLAQPEAQGPATALAVSPVGARVAVAYGASAGEAPALTAEGSSSGTSAVAVSPEGSSSGTSAVAVSPEGSSSDTTTAENPAAATSSQAPASGPALARIILWDLAGDSTNVYLTLDVGGTSISALTFSPDGSRLAAAAGTTVRVWDVANAQESKPLELDASVTALAFSPSGRNLIVGTDGGVVELWDSASGVAVRRFIADRIGGTSGPIRSLAFRPDELAIAALVGEKAIYTWDVYGYEAVQDRWPESGGAAFARFSSTGEGFVGANGGLSRVAPGNPATISRQQIEGLPLDVSLDGARAVISNGGLAIMDFAGGDVARADTPAPVLKALFAPDGTKILCILEGGIVQIRDGRSAALLREVGQLSGMFFAISPTHSQVAGVFSTIAGSSGTDLVEIVSLTVLDVASGQLTEIPGQDRVIRSMAYSLDGSLLALGYDDGTIDIRQVSDGQTLRSFAGHSGLVTALAFSADGALLLSGDGVGTVRVWDVASGEALGRFASQLGSITHVAISPDGGLIVATSGDGTTVVWQNRSGAALAEWVRANRYVPELSCKERVRYNVAPLCTPTPVEAPTAVP